MKDNNHLQVLCRNDNQFLILGLLALVEKAMLGRRKVKLSTDFSRHNISHADVIFISSMPALLYMCLPDFKFRKPESIVITMCDDMLTIKNNNLSYCVQDVLMVSSSEPIELISKRLAHRMMIAKTVSGFYFTPYHCEKCCFRYLTNWQLLILQYFRYGYSVQRIAAILNVSVKTIYAHKYLICERFGVKGEYEFNNFLNLISHNELAQRAIEFGGRKGPI